MLDFTEDVLVDDGQYGYRAASATSPILVAERGRRFSFCLCRKQEDFGDTSVDQWWMKVSSIYRQRNIRADNYQAVIDCWRAVCEKHGTFSDRGTLKTYILAMLLPEARSHGSRRVVADATPTWPRNHRRVRQGAIWELESQLAGSRSLELDKVAFRDRTADLIGPAQFSPELQERYHELAAELLDRGCEALQQNGSQGADVSKNIWQGWMVSTGRHRGHKLDKQVFDILSYECRAAMYRCYSAVWCELLPHLANKYAFSAASYRFHQFWHLARCEDSNEPEYGYFHLFHGHVFALHPACGLFIGTRTGSELMGEWLENPEASGTYGRLLQGICVAVEYYYRLRQISAAYREKNSRMETFSDMQALQERSIQRRGGRRRHRIRLTDAR